MDESKKKKKNRKKAKRAIQRVREAGRNSEEKAYQGGAF